MSVGTDAPSILKGKYRVEAVLALRLSSMNPRELEAAHFVDLGWISTQHIRFHQCDLGCELCA